MGASTTSTGAGGRVRKFLVILVVLVVFVYMYDYLVVAGTALFSPSLAPFASVISSRSQPPARPRPRPREPFKSFIRVPELHSADKYTMHSIYASIGRGEIRTTGYTNWALGQLSAIVQRQLKELETVAVQDCDETITLFCGYGGGTGLGSQVLHRQMCAMLSYVFGIPLIHDEGYWSYKKPWAEAFERVGSPCKKSKTHTLTHDHYSVDFLSGNVALLFHERGCEQNCTIEYPFKQHGLSVPKAIHDLILLLHEDPYMWWIGQFTKYMLRIKAGSETERYVAAWRQNLFNGNETRSRPIIGMHVRRSDKVSEAKLYGTGKYFELAAEILRNETEKSDLIEGKNLTTVTVFIASDAAHEVLLDARTNFSSFGGHRWSVIGADDQLTTYNQADRAQESSALDEIIRDVFILAEECDYVVCTLSSGVCQLVLQLMSSKYADGPSRVKSLDLQVDETIARWWAKVVFPV